MKRLVLIDGKSVFYRGYYAMGALSLSDGTPTGGVYGFAAIAMEIVKKLDPTKVVVAWDSKSSTSKRRAIYEAYKAGRVKPGEDFYTQIPLLEELIHDLGWNFVELPDYEADDIIGTLSHQADAAGDWETYIISSDLDMLQIVDENTHMWRILKGFTNIEQIDIAEIEAKYGIKKSQFLDLKSLKGDSSDNIPGVPGIGEKTAAKLLNDYQDLDSIYAHLDNIKGSTKTKLEAGRDSAYMSRRLAKIMFDAPVSLAALPDFHFNHDQVIAGLKKLEFNSLIRKLAKNLPEISLTPGPRPSGPSPRADGANSRAAALRIAPESTISSGSHLHESGDNDNSKSGNNAFEEHVRRRGERGATEARNDGPEGVFRKSVIPDFEKAIVDWDIKQLMHDNKDVAKRILAGESFWDLGQAAFLLNPLAREVPRLAVPEEECQAQFAEFQHYPRLYDIYTSFDLPLIPVLYKMEDKGMLIDRAYFTKLQTEYTKEVAKLERDVQNLAGANFNVNSPVQLSEILFTKLALPVKGIKKTTRGYSTGAKELDKLKNEHPIINKIIEYREAAKLLSTYITPIPTLADNHDRIHTTFTQNVTATGRLSSKDPNLQNIPVRTEEGKRIRQGFIAPAGKIFVSADYSQFELRLAAVLAGDQPLIDDFNNGVDIHTKTAAEAFNIPLDQVTKTQRRAAKAINFGIIYGMSINGLAEATHMSFADAKKFMDSYRELRAPIMKYMENTLKQAREQGFVETYYGRRRPTPDVKSSNFVIRQAAERAAENMPIQGTEADLMKRAMLNVDRALPKGADLVMQVHDSLIVECDASQQDEVATILKQNMESVAPELGVKLVVDVTSGHTWGEL